MKKYLNSIVSSMFNVEADRIFGNDLDEKLVIVPKKQCSCGSFDVICHLEQHTIEYKCISCGKNL